MRVNTKRRNWTELLLGGGEAPDPRFTLANERTFLAWIRTSLALLGGAIAIEAFATQVFEPGLRMAVAITLLVLSQLISAGACVRWLRVERALRQRRPLPLPALAPLLTMACVTAVVLIGSALWPRWHG
ncbi:YidH family protein [Pseudomonas sp. PHC1]|uniref:YidH family protein n=1 Tax=Pseudomonas sp. PHC1 TaxID=3384759 RepID=UPI00396F519F